MILAFALADLTLTHAMFAVIALQVVVHLVLRSSWVQAHASLKAALEEEEEVALVVTGALKHAVEKHPEGATVKQLAVEYATKNGVDDVLRVALQRKADSGA